MRSFLDSTLQGFIDGEQLTISALSCYGALIRIMLFSPMSAIGSCGVMPWVSFLEKTVLVRWPICR